MDFDAWANSLGHQFAVIGESPVPFAVAVLLICIAVWRAMEWQYRVRLDRQADEIVYLKAHAERPHPVPSVTTEVAPSAPVLRYDGPTVIPPSERVFVPASVTPDSLEKMTAGQNAIQVNRLTDSYRGKWIKTGGRVISSGISFGEVYIGFGPKMASKDDIAGYLARQVTAHFNSNVEGLEMIGTGDQIHVIGRIGQYSRHGLTLTDCELAS